MFKKILIPTDGSKAAHKAATVAKTIVEKYGSQEVIFLHVLPMANIATEGYVVNSISVGLLNIDESKLFENVKEIFKDTEVKVSTLLKRGYASDNIVSAAKEAQVDLIVIGSRGLSGLESFFLGSVSKQVVNDAPCMVLVVKR